MNLERVRTDLRSLQHRIVRALEALDGRRFMRDAWRRDALPPSATVARPRLAGCAFEALGVSAVLQPSNPYCPTAHLNVRLLAATPRAADARPPVFWFGGALDLTPYYGFEDDARHFHRTCRDALAPFGDTLYPRFKQACD